jgi:Right handed beta helix region
MLLLKQGQPWTQTLIPMTIFFQAQHKVKLKNHRFYYYLSLILLMFSHACFSKTIVIAPMTKIESNTAYKNVTLDLSAGSFIISKNASLNIENCIVNGTIAPNNPFLINLLNGKLILKNNRFNVTSSNIIPNRNNPSLYNTINIFQGDVTIVNNKFTIDKLYTVGLLITNKSPTSNIDISHNNIHHFHGGLLLRNSHHAIISNNKFSNISSSNIFILEGSNNLIKKNSILFSGNNNNGDGIDITDSDNITLRENYISSASCYSVVILRSKNIFIDKNKIIGGITYAIFISPTAYMLGLYHENFSLSFGKNQIKDFAATNININVTNNYLSQNRYGLAAGKVDGLTVRNNTFIQRFSNKNNRKFWTNNDILLKESINVIWDANLYKEAFTQVANDNNARSSNFVIYPLHGGVIL